MSIISLILFFRARSDAFNYATRFCPPEL